MTVIASSSGGAARGGAVPCYLRRATTQEDMRVFAALTMEYYNWLKEDLCFQGIDAELAGLPGCYAPPGGCIILATRSAPAAGAGGGPSPAPSLDDHVACVAIRPLEKEDAGGCCGGGPAEASPAEASPAGRACEMKRLWVRDGLQGSGIGRQLVAAAVEAARELGYKSLVLDTLERLTAANRLYELAGFRRRDAYYHNPLPNVVYWELDL